VFYVLTTILVVGVRFFVICIIGFLGDLKRHEHAQVYKTMAPTSTVPRTTQQIALPRSPANQYPLAALKQRTALVHPLLKAAGLLNILRNPIGTFYDSLIERALIPPGLLHAFRTNPAPCPQPDTSRGRGCCG
jgi:hypothetical protein